MLHGGVSAAGCWSFGRHGRHFTVAVAILLVVAAVRLGLRLGLRVGAGLAAADVVLAGAVFDDQRGRFFCSFLSLLIESSGW